MALSETQEKTPNENPKDKREKLATKVIIRRLPPGITQADFLNQVSPVPDYDYIYTVRGDMSLGENAFSRVYINFCNAEDVYLFKDKFDNYVFVDTKGHEYSAVVEYASFQKVPKRRKARPDPKIGSIEADPVYIEFLESLKEQPISNEEKPEFSYQPSTENKNDTTTPLLDFLKQRKIDRMRMREEKREERRKKEIEKKKLKDDDRKKRIEIKQKPVLKEAETKAKEDSRDEPSEKPPEKVRDFKNKEKKYEDRKAKKFSKYEEKKEFKNRRDDFYGRSKYDDKKSESNAPPKEAVKKIKKYSERREERRNEANKAEQKKDENKDTKETEGAKSEAKSESRSGNKSDDKKSDSADGEGEPTHRNKDNDPRAQRRIRNKDRPTMAIYKPGMLRKKSVDNGSKESEKEKDTSPQAQSEQE